MFTFSACIETQRQTNGDAITVGGQKAMLDKSIDRDWIAQCTNNVNSTNNNQPRKKPPVGPRPGSILTFQELCLSSTPLGLLHSRLFSGLIVVGTINGHLKRRFK